MRPLRVVHVGCELDRDRRGGVDLLEAWPTLPAVAVAVRDAGVEVSVVQAAHRDGIVRRGGVVFHFVAEPALCRIPGTRGAAGRLPLRLARTVARLRPDLLHLHGLAFPLHAALLARLGVPLLAQDHADRPPRRWRAVHRRGHARLSAAAFTAREQADPFFDAGLLAPGTPVLEIPESSSAFTAGSRRASRAAAGLHGDPAVLWIGRLDADKDPLTALAAFRLAAPLLPDAHLWCCFGAESLLPAVCARVAADPVLGARVHLLGRVPPENVEMLCRAADLFLTTSRRESAGYALLEALACGCAPVASDIPAVRALTGRGRIGWLAPAGDAPAFARALLAAATADRCACRRLVLDHFAHRLSFSALGASLAAAYEDLAGAHR